MVLLEGTIYVPPHKLEATQAALVEHIALTRAESGCLSFEVWPNPDNPLAFHVKEAFIDAEAYAAHQARTSASHWGKLTQTYELEYQTHGLDLPASLDESFMHLALELADRAAETGEVPVGAVLIRDEQVIGEGYNQPISALDPTAHAEIIALRQAALSQGNYRLPASTLYVTIEPCLMCVGALIHARVEHVVFGALESKTGALVSHPCLGAYPSNHRFEVTSGVLGEICGQRMSRFFATKR